MKTVMKGSAGKMVERNELPPAPLNVFEQALAEVEVPKKSSLTIQLIRQVKELADSGKSQNIIARELGRDEAWVKGSLLIANKLPEKVLQAIADSKFSRTVALQLLLANPAKLDEIVDGALKFAELEGKL